MDTYDDFMCLTQDIDISKMDDDQIVSILQQYKFIIKKKDEIIEDLVQTIQLFNQYKNETT